MKRSRNKLTSAIFSFLLLFLQVPRSSAQLDFLSSSVNRADQDYIDLIELDDREDSSHRGKKIEFILPESEIETEESLKELSKANYERLKKELPDDIFRLRSLYEKEYDWGLDEKLSLVWASHYNQLANGFATVVPNNISVFYPGGASLADQFAIDDWSFLLSAHELAHLYQLNVKTGPSKVIHSIFGNLPVPLFPIWIFPSPNIFLPTFMLEGNAVLNESRFLRGGRLHSGQVRALFYALIRSGKIDENRLTNDHIWFPFTTEKYIVGGHFFSFLARKFGLEKTNKIFLAQAEHWFNPLILNETFEDHFGATYSNLLAEFVEFHQKRAKIYRALEETKNPGELIARSVLYGELNHNEESVLFMANKKGRHHPKLFRIDRTNGQILETKKSHFAHGKVFYKEFFSTAAPLPGPLRTKIYFSLWGEDLMRMPFYENKLMAHQWKNYDAYIASASSYGTPVLVLDEVNRDKEEPTVIKRRIFPEGNSFPLIEERENSPALYYFKNKDQKKILYRDKEKIFAIEGHFARLCDVNPRGDVTFIASTALGSTVFTYYHSQKKIEKLLNLDNVIDFRPLKNGGAILQTVNDEGYEFRRLSASDLKTQSNIATSEKKDLPYYQRYSYEKALAPNTSSSPELKEGSYGYLRNLRFNAWGASYNYFESSGSSIFGFASFSDPLGLNYLFLTVDKNLSGFEDTYELRYFLSRYFLIPEIAAKYHSWGKELSSFSPQMDFWTTELGIRIPIYRYHNWNLDGKVSLLSTDRNSLWRHDLYSSISLTNRVLYPLSFFPENLLRLRAEGKSFDSERFSFSHDGQVVSQLFWETYLDLFWQYLRTDESLAFLGDGLNDDAVFSNSETLIIRGPDAKGAKLSASLSKVFNLGLYSSWFPLGLRRFSLSAIGNYYYHPFGSIDRPLEANSGEFGGGSSFEFLIAHRFPFRLGFNFFPESRSEGSELRVFSQFAMDSF